METTTNSTTSYSYNTYCGNRLPCGICRLTMTSCPLWNGCTITTTPTVTTTTTGTTTISASDVKEGETVSNSIWSLINTEKERSRR